MSASAPAPFAPHWPLVGREVERATAANAIRSGRPLVVWGPGGVGKTRLLRAIADDARGDGWSVRTATGTVSASGIPLGAVAHFVPAPLLDAARDQVLRAIVASIEESIADRDRLVLVVDDAHLLDDASATLIANLARQSSPRLALVVAHRPGPNVPDAVASIATGGGGERIELGPLDEPDTARLLEGGLGAPIDPVTVRLLVRWTRGNILFLRELVRDGIDRSVLRIEHGIWRWHGPPAMGPTLRQLIEARHRRLGDDALATLEVVAVGEPLSVPALAQLADERALAELGEAGLLEWSDDGERIDVRVSHPLHAEVLRSTIPAPRARRVRQEIAEVLGGDGATSADRMRRAVLLAEAGVAADPDALVDAARRAWALRDTELVDRLAHAARREGPHPEADYLLGETLADRGDYEGAVVAWLEILDGTLVEALRVRVAIAAAAVLALTLHRADEARVLLDRTEAQVGGADGRARLDGSRSALFLSGPATDRPADHDANGGRGAVGRTVDRDRVRVNDDVPDQARVFAWLGSAREWLLDGRTDSVLADADDLAAVADRVSEELPMGEMFVGICHFFALVHSGRLDEAEAFSEARRERSLLDPLPIAPATWSQGLGIVALTRGHLDVAATHLRAAAALLRGNDIGSLRHVLHELALASAQAADALGVAGALAEATTANSGLISPFVEDCRIDGALLAARGDASGARRVLRAAVDGRAQPVAFYDIPAWHDLARYGATGEAAAALGSWAEVVDGPVARWYADQAAALGRRDADELEAVAHSFEQHGYDLDAAETFAAASVPRGSSGDAARKSADRVRRAEAALARCGPVAPRTPMLASLGPMHALTIREREVASLAAEGLTDQDIAAHLGVSPRTVHAHLRSIYRKLDVSGRAELIARLADAR